MIPFVKAMVPVVDMAGRRILVSPPEGLLEMCSTKAIRVGAGCHNICVPLWVCWLPRYFRFSLGLYSSGCVFLHWGT